jgi:hypothetical protein
MPQGQTDIRSGVLAKNVFYHHLQIQQENNTATVTDKVATFFVY